MNTGEKEIKGTLTLAGREFEMQDELTAAQELFVQGQLRAAGVPAILSDPKCTFATHSEPVLTALLVSGRAVDVIAGMLVEVGKRWRDESAIANAEAFANITNRNEKQVLQSLLFGCVMGFFEQGEKFSQTSPSLSPGADADEKAATTGGESAAQGTLASSES